MEWYGHKKAVALILEGDWTRMERDIRIYSPYGPMVYEICDVERERDEKPECACRCHLHAEAYAHRDCILCGHRSPYVCATGWYPLQGPAGRMIQAPWG